VEQQHERGGCWIIVKRHSECQPGELEASQLQVPDQVISASLSCIYI